MSDQKSFNASLALPVFLAFAFVSMCAPRLGAPLPRPEVVDEMARIFSSALRRGAIAARKKRRDDALIKIGQQPFFR